MDAVSLISPMLGVVAVIILAYFATRWLATRGSFKPSSGKRIQVLERVPLTRDTSLAMVRVGGMTYLLSVGAGRAEKICELTDGAAGDAERPAGEFESLLSQRVNGSGRTAQEPRHFRSDTPDERRSRDQVEEERSRRGARR